MNVFHTVVVVVQVLAALSIIGLVLLQQGKGADMGAAFGSGASGSLFGASGSSNFLSKSTAFAAVIFFGATLALAFVGSRPSDEGVGVMGNLPAAPAPASQIPGAPPAAPGAAPEAPAAPALDPSVPTQQGGGQAGQIPR